MVRFGATTYGEGLLESESSERRRGRVYAVVEDERFASAAEAMLTQHLYQCDEISLEQWRRRPLLDRIVTWFAYQLRHWL
ncbi:MAG: hypothetical protein HYZ28_08030 [Myxococcales bacterium]|nr:hypothetical protein [Myxococcales bacterium]